MNWNHQDPGKNPRRLNNEYSNTNFPGFRVTNYNPNFQKRNPYMRTNKRRKSNSPPNSRVKLNFFDYDHREEDQVRNDSIQVVIENLDIECFNEDLDMNKARMSPIIKKQTTTSDLDPEFEIDYNLNRFFQNKKDNFVPYNFLEECQNQHNNFTGDLRSYMERNSLYKLRKTPKPCIKTLLPHEPHIKLTVLRTNLDTNVTPEYFITPRGMLNSNRNTDHNDVVIGRQQSTPEGIIPNDICLFYTDRATSRVHCKLVTKYGFKVPRDIPENFMAFLMSSHKRVGAKSPGNRLYKGLYRHIFSFIKEPRKFWLTDLGSVFGTYVKLKSTLTYPLEKGQTYLVGLDTFFNIIDVNKGVKPSKTNRRSHTSESTRASTESTGDDEFMKFLLQEKIYNKCEIHGLSESEETVLDQLITSHKSTLYEEDNIFDETTTSELPFQRPYLKLEIQNCRGIHASPNHLFVASSPAEFVLGRMQGCDINLNLNTISRRQSRFIYNEGAWYVSDGASAKESANGTWLSLTDYRMKRERTESEPRAIENGAEIKISDTILKVEIFNNE